MCVVVVFGTYYILRYLGELEQLVHCHQVASVNAGISKCVSVSKLMTYVIIPHVLRSILCYRAHI